MFTYHPSGVCCKEIHVDLDGNTITHVDFVKGCNGNLKAISKLVQGHDVDEIIGLLEGNTCGPRPTSCADQLTHALRAAREEEHAQA